MSEFSADSYTANNNVACLNQIQYTVSYDWEMGRKMMNVCSLTKLSISFLK